MSLRLRAASEDTQNQSQNLHYAILDEDGNPILTCRRADGDFEIGHELPSTGPPFYRLKARTGSVAETRLSTAGTWKLQLFGTGDCTAPQQIKLRVRSAWANLTIRFHFRDHLGSSSLTQSFRTLPASHRLDQDPLMRFNINGESLAFYDRGTSEAVYSPFGIQLNDDIPSEERPRYTGHEHDETTGLNYIKGRFQLSLQARSSARTPNATGISSTLPLSTYPD